MGLNRFEPGCCCCSGPDVILIYNSNAITDDDFDIRLNGTLIGNRLGNTSPLCKASIWSAGEAIDATWSDFPSGCSPVTVETFGLDTSLFVAGSNTLTMSRTADNGSGNFGIIQVVRLAQQGDGSYKSCQKWLDSNYVKSEGSPDPPPISFTFNWSA